MSRFEGTRDYVATDDLKVAVNAAIALERPLLIKGEPGTGKTMFLKFMLARLISARQVVLLYITSKVFLFYHDKVYSRPTRDGFRGLPVHQEATSGQSRRLLRTPFDGSRGGSRTMPLCWVCLYGIRLSC